MSALVDNQGLGTLLDNQNGKPAAKADLLDTVEKQMVTAFIGLNTVLRLRGKGYKFDETKKMTSKKNTPMKGAASSCPRKIFALRGNFIRLVASPVFRRQCSRFPWPPFPCPARWN